MFYYQYTKTQIEKELGSNLTSGLTQKEAANRLLKYGFNLLPEAPGESLLKIFLRQFKNPLIYILFICSAIVFYIGDQTDSLIILAVLVFNALVGAVQEGRSQKTLKSLKKLSDAE